MFFFHDIRPIDSVVSYKTHHGDKRPGEIKCSDKIYSKLSTISWIDIHNEQIKSIWALENTQNKVKLNKDIIRHISSEWLGGKTKRNKTKKKNNNRNKTKASGCIK